MANRCLEHSKVGGWPPFSIAIVDAGGALLVFTRQDGASAATADAAILKARTSVRSGAATGELAAVSKDPPTRDLLILLQLTDDPGGVPLVRLGNVLGAIGVSGGNAEQDTDCAKLAIAAFDKSLL